MTEEETGGVVREARSLIEDYAKFEIRVVEEPATGTKALVAIGAGGVNPIASSVFDSYRERPLRLRGAATMLSLDSLIEHVNRFKDAESAIFADDNRAAPSLTAIYDYHERANDGDIATALADATDIARNMLHRASFAFPLSDEWKAWMEQNGKAMPMAEFAAFIEDRIIDVLHIIPEEDELPEELKKFISSLGGEAIIATPQRLVELSRGLRVNEASAVREIVNLSSGEGQILFQAEHTDEHGFPLRVPSLFLIGIPVFRNDALYRLAARLRYRKTNGGIVFWYDLWRDDRVFDHAFRQACERVRIETDLPLLFGKPEA